MPDAAYQQSAVINDAQHRRIALLIEHEVGIQLPRHKRKLMETRLSKRLKACGYDSISRYLDYVTSEAGQSEKSAMVDSLTTNKTDFFREATHFDSLQEYLLEHHQRFSSTSPLRVWSAACSTGEEPYTVSMVLANYLQDDSPFAYKVYATDINSEVLRSARSAIYQPHQVEDIPLDYRKRYLLKSRTCSHNQDGSNDIHMRYKLCIAVRQHVFFEQFNLKSSHYPKPAQFDVIFCRNVLIYFSQEDRALVIENLAKCLKPGGLLILGLSESIGQRRNDFRVYGPTVYQKAVL